MSTRKKTAKNDLERLRLPELQARFRNVTGVSSRSSNRTFLLRGIRQALEKRARAKVKEASRPRTKKKEKAMQTKGAPAVEKAAADGQGAASPVDDEARSQVRGRFTTMPLEALQAMYLEVVGRATGSHDRRYLMWKIREAEKGRVPVGPRKPSGAEIDMKILPLRLPAEHVERMDVAWRSHGMRSRMEFFRRALGYYLVHLSAPETAKLFDVPPAKSA